MSGCEQEPIHNPGAIQPHGAVLATMADGRLITHASANLAAILGRPAAEVLGRPLEEVVGVAAYLALAGLREVVYVPTSDIGALSLRAHRSGRHICVDIEPSSPVPGFGTTATMAQSVFEAFSHAATCDDLCDLAVRGLRSISGYDRVIAYRFGENGHGEVIAEARAEQLEPYLGLRFPAGDVPPQARRLYLRQRVGAIADSSYQPVPLLADPSLDDGTPLDLTHSALRSVSPVHCEYMRNMKTAASLTIGLALGNDLWGMLVCHHAKPRIAGPALRAVADMIGLVMSLQLGNLGEAEARARQAERIGTLRTLADRLAAPMPLSEALAAAESDLLSLVGAAGALLRWSGTLISLGRHPPLSAAKRALEVLQSEAGSEVLAIDDLGLRYPDLAGCIQEGSGALLLPLQHADDAILWFRPEQSRTVTWGRNPAHHVTSDPATGRLSPRASFAAWRETVRGHAAPWAKADLAVVHELRTVVQAEVAHRNKAERAHLRHYDLLTGLPNRSLLNDWLVEALLEPGSRTAVMFLDIDRFKVVNDTMGHAAGDALLVEVAHRLLAAAGPEAPVARLGGDEFVVLCHGVDRETVAQLGERIRLTIAAPVQVLGRPCHVSASIGIAIADQSGGLDLLQGADMAMYIAKRFGGNRVKIFEPSLYDLAVRQFHLDHDLREALSGDDQFALVYQPIFGIAEGPLKLTGFEALLRWQRPGLGWTVPGLFIPQAEQSRLILPLGDWVLARALREGRARGEHDAGLSLAVNISALQLAQPAFCAGLAELLEAEGFPPEALCLEVTESMFNDVVVSVALADVRKLGVRVAIDDFGIGNSSLTYLHRLPADIVKLRRSVFADIDGKARGADFAAAVISVAHAAGLSAVAEGIETQAQLDIAAAAGADAVQGFLFGPPLSARAAAELAARPAT